MTDQKAAGLAQDNAPAHGPNPSSAAPSGKPPSSEQQWELALAHLGVGDRASNMLRMLLSFATIALLALVLTMLRPGLTGSPFWSHILALLFCIAALTSFAKALRLQSEQSLQRFRLLRDGNLEGLAQHDSVIEQLRGCQSAYWDRIAVWSLLAALLIEIAARLMSSSVMINV